VARRFFRHGELHLVVLHLLRLRPMHGYELMGELSRLFGPAYRPSAGSIYPAVESLEAEALIQGREREGRRVYRITRAGRSALDQRRELLAALEVRTGVRLPAEDGPEPALARFLSRVGAVAPRIDADALEAVLDGTAAELEAMAETHPPSRTPRRHPS
jgi:DNA-binding PadR family transcriptional regulator